VGALNEAPLPLQAGPPEPIMALPAPQTPPQGRIALLLHEDDLAGCKTVITPYAPAGWTADRLAATERDLAGRGIALHRIYRSWDRERWPHAMRGFFAFWAEVGR